MKNVSQTSFKFQKLTVVVDGVDEADPYVRVVVGHQHDVEQLLALRVQLAQSSVDGLQSLIDKHGHRSHSETDVSAMGETTQTHVVEAVASTLTKANAGPGANGSFSCSIW